MTVLSLLMLAEGRRPRPRKAPTVREPELALHMSVAAILQKDAAPDWKFAHYPAGEARDARHAAKLRAMGVTPGWPNFPGGRREDRDEPRN